MDISTDQLQGAILFLIALVLSITVHEFGHAWIATKLGDPLPKQQGRLTLSPLSHTDPIGTLVFPLIIYFTGAPLLGWGKPVQTNPLAYTRRFSRATGNLFVSVAGPAMNLVMAIVVSAIAIAGARVGLLSETMVVGLMRYLVALNLTLMFFNLLPIPPLDGGAVLAWVLPRSMQHIVETLGRWGFLILIGLMLSGLVAYVMYPASVMISVWVRAVLVGAGLLGAGA